MTRVLFVQGAAQRAGAERVMLSLARNLDPAEFTPVVAFLARGPFIDEVRDAGIEVVELLPSGRLRDLVRARSAVAALSRAIDETRADVVQATGEKMCVYAGWAARRAGRPCVFWLHDAPAAGSAAGRLVQLAMATTPRSAVVGCAAWLGAEFRSRLRMDAVHVHNGIEHDDLPAPRAARPGLLAECGWPDDAIVFGHFARLQRWKGTEVFLRAAARIAPHTPDARFLIVGGALFGREEAYAESLPELAASLGIADRVRFTGYRPDALELMAACDAAVHCSLAPDPFPMVILEAMGLGLPQIASRVRGPEEAISHARTGLLVDPGDEEGLAHALSRLAESADVRREMGAAARAESLERFTARRMAAEFEDLYRSLIPTVMTESRR